VIDEYEGYRDCCYTLVYIPLGKLKLFDNEYVKQLLFKRIKLIELSGTPYPEYPLNTDENLNKFKDMLDGIPALPYKKIKGAA
jgi:hypothetical protein